MRKLLSRFWLWLRVAFSDKASLRQTTNDVRDAVNDAKDAITRRPKKQKHCETLLWSGQFGAYRRGTPKIGRNALSENISKFDQISPERWD